MASWMSPHNGRPTGHTIQEAVLIDDDNNDEGRTIQDAVLIDDDNDDEGRTVQDAVLIDDDDDFPSVINIDPSLFDEKKHTTRTLKAESPEKATDDIRVLSYFNADRHNTGQHIGRAPVAQMSSYQSKPLSDIEEVTPASDDLSQKAGIEGAVPWKPPTDSQKVHRPDWLSSTSSDTISCAPLKEGVPPPEAVIAECLANGLREPHDLTQASHTQNTARLKEEPKAIMAESKDVVQKAKEKEADKARIGASTNVKDKSSPLQAQINACDTASSRSLCGLPALVQAHKKAPVFGHGGTPAAEAGPSGHKTITPKKALIPPTGIDISTEPSSKKRSHKKINDLPFDDLKFLNPNKKRTLGSLSLNTMYAPGQIASKNEFAKIKDARHQKRLEKSQQLAADNSSEVLQPPVASPEKTQIQGPDLLALQRPVAPQHADVEKTGLQASAAESVTVEDPPAEQDTVQFNLLATHAKPDDTRRRSIKPAVATPIAFETEEKGLQASASEPVTAHDIPIEQEKVQSITPAEPAKTHSTRTELVKTAITTPIASKSASEPRPASKKKTLPSAAEPATGHNETIEHETVQSKTPAKPAKPHSTGKEPVETATTTPVASESASEPHPTTSRKTLSKAAQAYNVSTHADGTMPTDPDQRYETVHSIYHYHVTLRNSPSSGSDNIGVEKMMGPFHTLVEANAVAAEEVRHLITDGNGDAVFDIGESGTGWSFQHVVDEVGMLTETLRAGGLVAEATVSRGISPSIMQTLFAVHKSMI